MAGLQLENPNFSCLSRLERRRSSKEPSCSTPELVEAVLDGFGGHGDCSRRVLGVLRGDRNLKRVLDFILEVGWFKYELRLRLWS